MKSSILFFGPSDFVGHNNSYIYILTSQELESNKVYKIGFSSDVQKRLSQLNCEHRTDESKLYIVYKNILRSV